VTGLLLWPLTLAIRTWALRPLFCRTPDAATICNNSDVAAYIAALILLGVMAAALLTRWRVHRPVLIALAFVVSMSGLVAQLTTFDGFAAVAWCVGLSILTMVLFERLTRIRRYWRAVTAVVIVAIGLVIAAHLL
jgi:hypothetical protein